MSFLPKRGDHTRNPALQEQNTYFNRNSLGYNQNKEAPAVNQSQKGLNPTIQQYQQFQNHQTQNKFSPPHMPHEPIKYKLQRDNSIPNKFIGLNEQKPSQGDDSDVQDPDNEEGNIGEDHEGETGKIIRSNKITAPPFLPQDYINQISQSQISSKEINASQGRQDKTIKVPFQNMNNIHQLQGNMDEAISEQFYSCNGDPYIFNQINSAHSHLQMSQKRQPEQISNQNSRIAQQPKMNSSRIDSHRLDQDNIILFDDENSSYSKIGVTNSQAQNDLRYNISKQRHQNSSNLIDFDQNSYQDKYNPQESELKEQYIQSNQNSRIIAMESKAEQVQMQIDERVKHYNFDQKKERIQNIYDAVVTKESVKQIENYLKDLQRKGIKEIYETRKLKGIIQQLEKSFLGQIEMSEGEAFINENNVKCYWIPYKLKESKLSNLNRKLQDSILYGDYVVNEIKLQCSFLEFIRTSTYSTLAKLLDRSTPVASEKKVTIEQFNQKINKQLSSFIQQGIEELDKSENIKNLKLEAQNKLENIKTIEANFQILNAVINKDFIDEFEKLKTLIIFKQTTNLCEEFEALFKESIRKQTSTFSKYLEKIFKLSQESQKQKTIQHPSDFEKYIQTQNHQLFTVQQQSIQKTQQRINNYLKNIDNYLLNYHLCSFDQSLYDKFLSEEYNRIIIEYFQTNYKNRNQDLSSIYTFLEKPNILMWFIFTLSQIFQKNGFKISQNIDKEAYNKIDEEMFILFNFVLNNMIDQRTVLEQIYHSETHNPIINQIKTLPKLFEYEFEFLPKEKLSSIKSDQKQKVIFCLDKNCDLKYIMISIPNFPLNFTVSSRLSAYLQNSIISLANQHSCNYAFFYALYILRLLSFERLLETELPRFIQEYKDDYKLIHQILENSSKYNFIINSPQIPIYTYDQFLLQKQKIKDDKREAGVIRVMSQNTQQADRIIFYKNSQLNLLLLFPDPNEVSQIQEGKQSKEYKKIKILINPNQQNLLRIIFFEYMESQNLFTWFFMKGLLKVIDETFSLSSIQQKKLSEGLIQKWIERSAKYYQKQTKELERIEQQSKMERQKSKQYQNNERNNYYQQKY